MHTDSNDVFERKLDDAIVTLQQCQQEKRVASCSDCEHYIGCEVRKAYVQAVYDSMSKGETGGFEF